MPLLSLVIILIVIGVLLYVVNTQIPMDANIRKIINIVVIVVVCIWLLQLILPLGSLPNVRIGR